MTNDLSEPKFKKIESFLVQSAVEETSKDIESFPVQSAIEETPKVIESFPVQLETESIPQKKRDLYYLNYIMTGIGLFIIGICALLGFENNKENTVFNIVLLIGSLILLLGASDIVLEYAVKLSEFLHIPEIVIGLTIVSLGTSIPEMFTAIAAAQHGSGIIVIGDIYGSYITQLSLFLGIVVLFAPGTVSKKFVPRVRRDGFLMLCALLYLSFNLLDGKLTRIEGVISVSIYISYIIYLYINARKKPEFKKEADQIVEGLTELERVYTEDEFAQHELKHVIQNNEVTPIEKEIAQVLQEKNKPKAWSVLFYILMIIIGAFGCYFGATYVVVSGSDLAYSMNVPTHIVAATIIGFGTGFPEFVVSFMAIRKHKIDIAYGNLLGSNIVDPLVSISLGVFASEITLTNFEVASILSSILSIAIILDLFIIFAFSRKSSGRKYSYVIGTILIIFYLFFLLLH